MITEQKGKNQRTQSTPSTYKRSLGLLDKARAFHYIKEENPQFVRYLLNDLLEIEGYTENEIAFGLNLPLNYIRKISEGNCHQVSRNTFLAILNLYARVFCGWCHFQDGL